MINKIPVIIDTDPGVDDALALMLALRSEKLDVKLICAVGGNVGIENTSNNTVFLRNFCKSSALTARGCDKPLCRIGREAPEVHGAEGLGNFVLPTGDYKTDFQDGICAMADVILHSPEKITLIALGPLTDIAMLFRKYPDTKQNISRIYSMSASIDGRGNITPYAEFNVFYDPEAFDELINSGVNITFAPMQLGENIALEKSALTDAVYGKPGFELISKMLQGLVESNLDFDHIAMYDPNAVFALLHPELYKILPCDAQVDTDEFPGRTFLKNNINGKFNCIYADDTTAIEQKIISELAK